MEENHRRTPQRNSRAAQEAQRRRQARQVEQKMEHRRQNQRRRARRRTGGRVGSGLWKRLLIMAGVVAAVVLSMVIFFRVRHIEVQGNRYYSAEEIISAAGVAKGDNLLTLSRAGIAASITSGEDMAYVRTVSVTRRLPDTLIITITEDNVTFAMQDEAGQYYLITAYGKATQQVESYEASEHIQIKELTIATPTIGEQITVTEDESGSASAKLDALQAVLTALELPENVELLKSVSYISLPAAYDIQLQYGSQYTVKLGNLDDMEYKLAALRETLKKLADYQTGTIDISEGSSGKVRFSPAD